MDNDTFVAWLTGYLQGNRHESPVIQLTAIRKTLAVTLEAARTTPGGLTGDEILAEVKHALGEDT